MQEIKKNKKGKFANVLGSKHDRFNAINCHNAKKQQELVLSRNCDGLLFHFVSEISTFYYIQTRKWYRFNYKKLKPMLFTFLLLLLFNMGVILFNV